ncbi:MAG: ornithine racemase Orr [Bacillota bacterium]
MNHPVLIIDKAKLRHNAEVVLKMCREANIEVCAVTKAFCAHPEIAETLIEAGINCLADSRIQNLKKLRRLPITKMLLRIPMLSEVEEVVRYAQISLNSELKTVEALSAAALKTGKKHGIIIMIELGDLREGILPGEAVEFAGKVLGLPGVQLLGVGVNLNCHGGIIPDRKNLGQLVSVAGEIEAEYGIRLQTISGGNSGSFYLVRDHQMPPGINQLRLGEVILLGRETSFQQKIDGLYTDVFTFQAEIVELKEKPSVPYGEMGRDSFGLRPGFQDKGVIKRAIAACGKQDILWNQLTPHQQGIDLIGASSDHLLLDVTHAGRDYTVGDTVDFSLSYGALLAAFTSEYVYKYCI